MTDREQTFADSNIQTEVAKLAFTLLSADELAHLAFMKYREGLNRTSNRGESNASNIKKP